jgi:hypothetical protein
MNTNDFQVFGGQWWLFWVLLGIGARPNCRRQRAFGGAQHLLGGLKHAFGSAQYMFEGAQYMFGSLKHVFGSAPPMFGAAARAFEWFKHAFQWLPQTDEARTQPPGSGIPSGGHGGTRMHAVDEMGRGLTSEVSGRGRFVACGKTVVCVHVYPI